MLIHIENGKGGRAGAPYCIRGSWGFCETMRSARAVVVTGPGPEGDERDTLEDDDPICRQTGVEIAVGRDQPSRVRHTLASVCGRIAVEHLDEKRQGAAPYEKSDSRRAKGALLRLATTRNSLCAEPSAEREHAIGVMHVQNLYMRRSQRAILPTQPDRRRGRNSNSFAPLVARSAWKSSR